MTRPSWNKYYIEIAKVVSSRSIDPSTKVGAVIVSEKNRIVSCGYNGFPAGLSDEKLTLEKTPTQIKEDLVATKYHFIIHAKLNAILSSEKSLEGCKIYTTLFPCSECAKAIVASKIQEVIFLDQREKMDYKISEYILKEANVKLTKINPEDN